MNNNVDASSISDDN